MYVCMWSYRWCTRPPHVHMVHTCTYKLYKSKETLGLSDGVFKYWVSPHKKPKKIKTSNTGTVVHVYMYSKLLASTTSKIIHYFNHTINSRRKSLFTTFYLFTNIYHATMLPSKSYHQHEHSNPSKPVSNDDDLSTTFASTQHAHRVSTFWHGNHVSFSFSRHWVDTCVW